MKINPIFTLTFVQTKLQDIIKSEITIKTANSVINIHPSHPTKTHIIKPNLTHTLPLQLTIITLNNLL